MVQRLKDSQLDEALEALEQGKIILAPTPVGYVLTTSQASMLPKLFEIKQRPHQKNFSVLGHWHIIADIFGEKIGTQSRQLQNTIGLVDEIPFQWQGNLPQHAIRNNQLAIMIKTGPLLESLALRLWKKRQYLFGTSANFSGHGNCYQLENVEKEILNQVDFIIKNQTEELPQQKDWGKASPIYSLYDQKFLRQGLKQKEIEVQLQEAGILSL